LTPAKSEFRGAETPVLERTEFRDDALCDNHGRRKSGPQIPGVGDFQWRSGPQALALFAAGAAGPKTARRPGARGVQSSQSSGNLREIRALGPPGRAIFGQSSRNPGVLPTAAPSRPDGLPAPAARRAEPGPGPGRSHRGPEPLDQASTRPCPAAPPCLPAIVPCPRSPFLAQPL